VLFGSNGNSYTISTHSDMCVCVCVFVCVCVCVCVYIYIYIYIHNIETLIEQKILKKKSHRLMPRATEFSALRNTEYRAMSASGQLPVLVKQVSPSPSSFNGYVDR
jgi:ABC-type lipoprotein release transport system permease subunit